MILWGREKSRSFLHFNLILLPIVDFFCFLCIMSVKNIEIYEEATLSYKFLSDVVDMDSISLGKLNLIEAPCGAGKTTLALEKMPQEYYEPSRSVYLIDTLAGKEQLLRKPICKEYKCNSPDVHTHFSSAEDPENNKITVMTYAQFGVLCELSPDWFLNLDTVFCDEIHSLIAMKSWETNEEKNFHKIAWEALVNCIKSKDGPTLIAITATSTPVFKALGGYSRISPTTHTAEWYSPFVNRVRYTDKPRRYMPKKVEHYYNLTWLCSSVLQKGKKGIIYVSYISMINHCVEVLSKRGFKAVGLWSTHNDNYPLTKEQLQVRTSIIETEAIPDDIDVLIINKSCETSINIKSHVDYMVIHTLNTTSKFQAMGRYRGNLDLVYIKWPMCKGEAYISNDMLNKKLYKEDVDNFISQNNIRVSNGRLMGQPSFLESLKNQGYKITAKKEKGGKRYHIISAPGGTQI